METDEELEQKFIDFKVQCERIKHDLDVIEERIDELEVEEPSNGLTQFINRFLTAPNTIKI